MESVAYCRSPSPSLISPRQRQPSRRSLGPIRELRSGQLCPYVIRSSDLFTPTSMLPVHTTANAVNEFCSVAAASPAKSGDISVFLQTSAVLLGMYWIANFVVPDLISKYFGFDKVGQEDDQNKPNEDDSTKEGGSSSPTKGQGFNSTRS
ncbi:uncharacterized protein LOC116192044 [Punica granatum]|uniref:Uncharacterized protein n=2 Tax=Punica granatum TaxID=22663 RepID=A0A218X7V4_PUNGR|nr:uncharacterized protein LOC116192044 [Punica granatum]OWM81285.1 hypothetical protein CDL15_Pgr007323 [Punica granatum]PKI67718.1 hypothetical protein CRG98_011931 [Punica granatum]